MGSGGDGGTRGLIARRTHVLLTHPLVTPPTRTRRSRSCLSLHSQLATLMSDIGGGWRPSSSRKRGLFGERELLASGPLPCHTRFTRHTRACSHTRLGRRHAAAAAATAAAIAAAAAMPPPATATAATTTSAAAVDFRFLNTTHTARRRAETESTTCRRRRRRGGGGGWRWWKWRWRRRRRRHGVASGGVGGGVAATWRRVRLSVVAVAMRAAKAGGQDSTGNARLMTGHQGHQVSERV